MITVARKGAGALLAVLLCLAGLALPARGAAYPPVKDAGNGLVMTSHALADAVGREVLESGGNAVDAAVAVGYALAVVHPAAGNIGGGGFAVIRMADGETVTCDFREKAPLAATPDMYLDAAGNVIPGAGTLGYKAAAVPGTVAGLSVLSARFGTKPLPDLMAPAIRLAREGFAINARQERSMAEFAADFAKFSSTGKYFLKPDGTAYKEGERFIQKDLARTLSLVAEEGPDAFYRGAVAELIVRDMEANGGLVSREDLAGYTVAWREPVKGTYRGYEIFSMAPPSSGGTHVIQILNIMENADMGAMGFASSQTIHLMAEAMRHAYADRSEYMGDPDFVDVPVERLLSKEYGKAVYEKITAKAGKATPSTDVRPGLPLREGSNTTHYSIVDKWGNAVAVTYTINESYGSAAAVAGAGFLLNNEMDDFSAKPGAPNIYGLVGSDANRIEAGKRPLSCMSPTIVVKDGKVFMVVGSPGGSRIITTTLQVISNVIDHGMSISEAVMAPRVHMQWQPDELRVEKYGLSRDAETALQGMGYAIEVKKPMGDVNAIHVGEDGVMYGSGDPRAEF